MRNYYIYTLIFIFTLFYACANNLGNSPNTQSPIKKHSKTPVKSIVTGISSEAVREFSDEHLNEIHLGNSSPNTQSPIEKHSIKKYPKTPGESVDTGISRETVRKVVDEHLNEIHYCYETSLFANPLLMGKVLFKWYLEKNGSVTKVEIISSTIPQKDLELCVKSKIITWKFPELETNEAEVTYPFVFDVSGY